MSYSMEKRLTELREVMAKESLNVYIVPHSDEHLNEYIPEHSNRLEYITKFTGSSGIAVITMNEAFLWTDSRYFIQAEKELDSMYWQLMKSGLPNVPGIFDWMKKNLAENTVVGYDPKLISMSKCREYESLTQRYELTLKPVEKNLVDKVWEKDSKPSMQTKSIVTHDKLYTGYDSFEKLKALRKNLMEEKVDMFITTQLDEIAWITNLRGSDIPYTPLFLSYFILTLEAAIIYLDMSKLTSNAEVYLSTANINVRPYETFFEELCYRKIYANTIWMDPHTTSSFIYKAFDGPKNKVIDGLSFAALPKAIKNQVEINGMIEAHIKDGLAKSAFLAWIDYRIETDKDSFFLNEDEFTLAAKLNRMRSLMHNNVGLSFETISALGSNSAIVHYRAHKDSAKKLKENQVYLVDSGGQYLDGTTDVTRTIKIGNPTPMEKLMYTRVLQGHLALKHQTFPDRTTGSQLDVLARTFLWNHAHDYMHGTGHGVGSYLNVHEGPQSICQSRFPYDIPLKPGMVLSIEPGVYRTEFGIRIENLVYVDKVIGQTSDKPQYYKFTDLTLVPYHKALINLSLLTDQERFKINKYHNTILETFNSRWSFAEPLQSEIDLDFFKSWLTTQAEPI